jgi:hypothetical protein
MDGHFKGGEMRTLLVVLALCMMLFGCGGEEADTGGNGDTAGGDEVVEPDVPEVPDEPFVGTWEVVEVRGEDIGNTGNIYTFEADGNMSIGSGSFVNEGTWSMAGDTVVAMFGSVEMPALVSFEGDNLVYEIVNGTQIFVMEPR